MIIREDKMSSMRIIAVVFTLALTKVLGQNDDTLTPEAKGSGVVETTLIRIESSCIFPDDKLLMRRMSYVESSDGEHLDTFRDGYHGGIWQVDEEFLEATQGYSSAISAYISQIKVEFGIDWQLVKWEDLRMPLYSALGCRLYLEWKSPSDKYAIPRDIEGQADYWKQNYRPNGDTQYFIDASNELESHCTKSAGVDMVFVLDASGSIGSYNFETMKRFVQDVIKSFDIGPDTKHTRVGVMAYSSYVDRAIDLGDFFDEQALLDAVDDIHYLGGNTHTAEALNEMTFVSFTTINGARPENAGHPRVGIVLTDGHSNDLTATVMAAMRAHERDITMFAIGIGDNVDMTELEAIASIPTCLHLFLLDGFEEVESLKYQIEKATCDAPVIINPSNNGTDTEGKIPPDGDQNCKVRIGVDGVTIKITAVTGGVDYYTSTITYPSSSYYEHTIKAVPGKTGVMFIPQPPTEDDEGIVYCNLKGRNDSASEIVIGIRPGEQDWCESNPCHNGGECYDMGDDGYKCMCTNGYAGTNCEIAPTTTTITTTTTATTTTQAPSSGGYDCGDNNPCTPENIAAEKFYFQHHDEKNFVQCSASGQCFVMACMPGTVWEPELNTCA